MKISPGHWMVAFTLFLPGILFAQKTSSFSLAELHSKGKLNVVGRSIKVETEGTKKFIRLSEDSKEGLVWLSGESFSNGQIEILMRGKDVLQRSFIGIAFHGLNDSTFDAVYCRPFNFLTPDSVRRIHAIEYISHPQYTWQRLRAEFNGQFEKGISDPPDPNGWFRMTLLIDGKSVKAFINDKKEPSLVVEKLNPRSTGMVGIFTGDGSGIDVEQITIRHKNN